MLDRFLVACSPVRGATRSTWLWAGHYPEKRTFYIARLASLVKFECRELDPSTVKRAVGWQQGPAFVAQFGSASEGRQDPRHRRRLHRRVLVAQGFGS